MLFRVLNIFTLLGSYQHHPHNFFHLVKLKLYTHEITPAPFPEHLETTIELSVSTNLTTLETHRSGTIQRFFVTGLFHLA